MTGGSTTTAAELLAWVYAEAKRFSDPDGHEHETGPWRSRTDDEAPLPSSVPGSSVDTASSSGTTCTCC